jgi:hypothetical protein
MAAGTGKGRRGANQRAGAGAAVHRLDKEGWRSVAHHSRTTKTSWPAWKMLRWRGSATVADRVALRCGRGAAPKGTEDVIPR